jgi:hypothetical protein
MEKPRQTEANGNALQKMAVLRIALYEHKKTAQPFLHNIPH